MFDKSSITVIQADLRAALDAVAAKHNLKAAPFKITYSDVDFRFTCVMGDRSVGGDTNPKFVATLRTYGPIYKLSVEMLGRSFKFGKDVVKLAGMKSAGKVVIEKDGKLYLMDVDKFVAIVLPNPVPVVA